MSILRITGDLLVRVDDVDVEQTCIEHPKTVEGFPIALQAMVAALLKDEVKAFHRQMYKSNHTLEYVASEYCEDAWLVTFMIRGRKPHELAMIVGRDADAE